MDNQTIARRLRAYANELDRKHASLYRVRAYRRAAATVQAQERALTELVAAWAAPGTSRGHLQLPREAIRPTWEGFR